VIPDASGKSGNVAYI